MKDATNRVKRKNRFTKASGVLDRQIKAVAQTRGFSQSRLLTHWRDIVGQDIAAITQPIQIKTARTGENVTLILFVNGANGPQVQMQIPQIIERVNATYGFNAIRNIKLTQTNRFEFAQQQKPFLRDRTKALSPATHKRIDQMVDPVADTDLKSALATLGRHIAAKQTKGPQ